MRNLKGKIVLVGITVLLISAVYTNVVSAVGNALLINAKPSLENVRDYAPAASATALTYAVDGGFLYVGQPNHWVQRPTPPDVVVAAVAVDPNDTQKVYIGAANELTLYWSLDGGQAWRRVPLSDQYMGGVTDIAFNRAQRTLYVATDTAGIFRLRDVGSSIILSGQSYLDAAVLEVVTDQSGAGLVFARTEWQVYRGFNNGMQWLALDTLTSAPTALAITGDHPATVYVGTVDRGLLKSQDGYTWETVNAGFVQEAGTRLRIDALAVDPAQPAVLYVATSYLFGSTQVHQTAAGVAMSVDNAAQWTPLVIQPSAPIVRLLPVSGVEGAVYGLTNLSRTPQPLGKTLDLATRTVAEINPAGQTMATTWPTPLLGWLAAILTTAILIGFLLRELYKGTAVLERRPQANLVERIFQGIQIDRLAHRLGLS
jgi:hypothetical protein